MANMPLIRFKTPEMRDEFRHLRRKLISIICAMAVYGFERFNKIITVTSVYRKNDMGVHGLWRGCDIRTSNFTRAERQELSNFINEHTEYDPVREGMHCCIYGTLDKNGKHDDHFHIQVHPRTKTCFWVTI